MADMKKVYDDLIIINLYVIAFSELLLLCLALLQLVQGPLKQSVFLNVTIIKKFLNPYPNYD